MANNINNTQTLVLQIHSVFLQKNWKCVGLRENDKFSNSCLGYAPTGWNSNTSLYTFVYERPNTSGHLVIKMQPVDNMLSVHLGNNSTSEVWSTELNVNDFTSGKDQEGSLAALKHHLETRLLNHLPDKSSKSEKDSSKDSSNSKTTRPERPERYNPDDEDDDDNDVARGIPPGLIDPFGGRGGPDPLRVHPRHGNPDLDPLAGGAPSNLFGPRQFLPGGGVRGGPQGIGGGAQPRFDPFGPFGTTGTDPDPDHFPPQRGPRPGPGRGGRGGGFPGGGGFPDII